MHASGVVLRLVDIPEYGRRWPADVTRVKCLLSLLDIDDFLAHLMGTCVPLV